MKSAIWRAPWIYTSPFIIILICHYFVDIYSSLIPPLIGVVQTEQGMKPASAALLLGVGSICSGLSQPIFAWISDLTRTRVFGPLGILLAGMGICTLGYYHTPQLVFLVYAVGMMGVGMFHPIATAKIGQLAGDERGFAISLFFVCGMGGFFTGSLLGPLAVTLGGSTQALIYFIAPSLVMAFLLLKNIDKSPVISTDTAAADLPLSSYDWWSIVPLYFSAAFRFTVNMSILYLIVRWVEADIHAQQPLLNKEEISRAAAPLAGQATAIMFVGQGLSGLIAGAIVKSGKEGWPLVLTPILFAPFMMLLAFMPPNALSLCLCFFVGVGFAAMTPVTISVGQKLMPSHIRLASGLMLGGAWALGSVGPGLAQWCIEALGLPNAIIATACILIVAGITASPVAFRSNKHDRNQQNS